jgi:purine-cytosine permease-like protein
LPFALHVVTPKHKKLERKQENSEAELVHYLLEKLHTYMSKISFANDQDFYNLACIQSVSLGLSVIILGKQFAEQFGPGTAICSVFIGNLILWLIGLAVISTVYQAHTNAIENIRGYFGKAGAVFFVLILVFAFLDWYAMQIKSTLIGLETLSYGYLPWKEGFSLRIGAVLGILSAILAIGGIRLFKWLATATFVPILIYNLFIIATSKYSLPQKLEFGLSFQAIVVTVLTLLPGVINLPTFFRYSKSKIDSYLA